jgi:parallel beta-helix repeat protein
MKTIAKIVVKVVFLSLLLVCTASLSMATIYYVSSTGNDANSGLTTALPWKTLIKVNSRIFFAGDQILFNKGDTFHGSITVNGSGTSVNPITFGAYGTGANPIITGFTDVTAWTNLGGNIWESTDVVSTLSTCNMVVINGVNTPMGRFPNTGYYYFQSHSDNYHITSSYLTDTQNWTGAELAFNCNNWETKRVPITAQTAGTLTFTQPEAFTIRENGLKFIIQNDIRTLDVQNEWYYNPSTKKISVYSTSQPTNVKVATTSDIITCNQDYIVFDGLSVKGANSKGFVITGADHLKIQNCTISFSGRDAIFGTYTTTDAVLVDGCTISESNNGGIGLPYHFINATFTDNAITNTAMIYGATAILLSNQNSAGMGVAIASQGDGCTFTGNTITNTGYIGIRFRGNNILIQNNFINKFCQINHDGGAIYSWNGDTNTSYSGTIVKNNIILNETTVPNYAGDAGIYLDDASNGVSVIGSSIYNCGFGIYLHNSHDNIIRSNTIYGCGNALHIVNNNMEITMSNQRIASNIFVATGTTNKVASIDYTETIQPVYSADSNYYARPQDDITTIEYRVRNPLYSYNLLTLAKWQTYTGQEVHSKKSPQAITSENDLQFEYNATKTAKTISLSQPMIDVKGTKYVTSVILQPFTSVVLMKDAKPTKYSIEHKSICDGLSYNGWTTTGKYERTLLAKSGADSIVTTYLTVNPKYAIQENVTILSGETYQGWSTSGTYTRTLSSVSGCDSVITTYLTVDISAVKVVTTQTIQLKKGNNMISTYLQATNPDVSVVTQTIRDSGNLIKMQNESGSSYENWGILGGWINNLGSLQNTEGYKIMVANDCALQITGNQIALPLNISLNVGWNIISFPRADILDAQMIIQSLIDQSALVKVQDEIGNSIEDWGIYGGWKNGIGNFLPGKAYRVKVSKSATLTIQDIYPKSVAIPFYAELPEHFQSVTEGNGSDHMNINLVGLNQSGLSAGDELAAFDGNLCVGTLKITEQHLIDGTASLVASCSTNNLQKDGFDEGSSIQVRIWNHVSGIESGIQLSFLQGSKTYSKSATMLGKIPNLTTSISNFEEETRIEVYPNPSQGKFTVRFSEIPASGSRIDILDLSGRKVASQLINGISEEFDLLGQAAGMYLVKSIIGSVEKINKLVIQ